MTTLARIEDDANEYATFLDDQNEDHSFDEDAWINFIAGAKSERNKTIDEAIDIVTDYQDYNPLIIERLKAMKI